MLQQRRLTHFGAIASSLCVVAALAASAQAQQFVRSVYGPSAGQRFGAASIRIPDQNADGYADLLVGAPGYNQERGAVHCVSGAYMATGVGFQILWSSTPTANQGDRFGTALADLGDLTGDGVHEYLVGQPGYDLSGQNDIGAVRILNGASHR